LRDGSSAAVEAAKGALRRGRRAIVSKRFMAVLESVEDLLIKTDRDA
jgi:hypothetical protein